MSWTGELTEKCSSADFDPADFEPGDFETEAYGLSGGITEKEPWTSSLAEKQNWNGTITVKEP